MTSSGKDLPIDSENFKLQSLIDAQLNATWNCVKECLMYRALAMDRQILAFVSISSVTLPSRPFLSGSMISNWRPREDEMAGLFVSEEHIWRYNDFKQRPNAQPAR